MFFRDSSDTHSPDSLWIVLNSICAWFKLIHWIALRSVNASSRCNEIRCNSGLLTRGARGQENFFWAVASGIGFSQRNDCQGDGKQRCFSEIPLTHIPLTLFGLF